MRRDAPGTRPDGVPHPWPQVPDAPELEPYGKGVLIADGDRGIELVAGEHDILAGTWAPGIDAHAHEGEARVGLYDEAAVPFPPAQGLDSAGVAGARNEVARP